MIALYKGISAISRVIRLKTWSEYSHAAWVDHGDMLIEAWMPDGVRCVNFAQRHTPGTQIDVFDLDITDYQRGQIRDFLMSQLGKPYDLKGILGFVTHRTESPVDQAAWFCSELVFAACVSARVDLLKRILPCKVYPGMIGYSPVLHLVDKIACPIQDEAGQEAIA